MKKKYTILMVLSLMYNRINFGEKILQTETSIFNNQNHFQTQAINTIPNPPTIQTIIDWRKKFLPQIQEMILFIKKIQDKNNITTLFINKIENCSDHPLNIQQTTNNLKNLLNELNNNNQYIIINPNISHEIYENIESLNKNLTPRSTSIKLARYIHAEYMLYSTAHSNTKNITYIKLELISIKNGEIIWSKTTCI